MTLEIADLDLTNPTHQSLNPALVLRAGSHVTDRRSKTTIPFSSLSAGVREAKRLFGSGSFLDAFDVYEQLVVAHPEHSIELLAELYDLYQALPNKEDRYTLYQARLFDFGISPSDKVLDVGSGNIPFPLATHLADLSPDDDYYGRAGAPLKRINGKPLYICNLEDLNCFGDKEFDFVYCSHVLEHVRNPERACSELSRIGKRGYIETPTRGKDLWLNTAKISNHLWSVELLKSKLIFTEYAPEEIEGLQSDLLMKMHVRPESQREKALTSLIYLKADRVNTMFPWEGELECEVRRCSAVASPANTAFRPKTIQPWPTKSQAPHQLKVYADRRYLPPGTKHTPLLVPLWGDIDKEGDPDWLRFKNYSSAGRDYFVQTDVSEADIVLLPSDWTHCQHEAHRLAEVALESSKPYVIFFINDSEEPVGIEQSTVFRTSGRRSAPRANEFAVPAWSVDFKDHYFGGQIPTRKKESKPIVGFCGFVPQEEANLRRIAINALGASGLVTTNFLLRSEFCAGALRSPAETIRQVRREYADNIAESDYVLCVRGAGNFSYRLYETLSSGRIPVFVDTDCLLPFENYIDWKSYCVWVDVNDLSSIGEKVAEFHERLAAHEFIDLQHACRELWVKWLSPEGFFANFHRYFTEPKTVNATQQVSSQPSGSYPGRPIPTLCLRVSQSQPSQSYPASAARLALRISGSTEPETVRSEPDNLNASDEPTEADVCQALRGVVQKGWTCVDVGANVGLITAVLAECVGPKGKVLAFEAHPENAKALRDNMKSKGYAPRVRVGNLAITDGNRSSVSLYAGRRNSPCEWNIVGHDVDGKPTAPVLTIAAAKLDIFFPKGSPLDLVKIDVEGAAGSVLRGMSRLLREVRPILVIEFHHEAEWEARTLLFDLKYALQDLSGRKLDPATDTQRLYHCLAIPSERSPKAQDSQNPNTVHFYDTLYRGRFESNGTSIEYQYEGPDRVAWYQKVASQPFFQCSGKILDVGCGNAGLFYQLPEALPLEKYGIDFSEVAIDAARERVKGDFRVGDVHHLPYADEFFDRVVSTETLEHVDNAAAVVREMARVLKPGGKLFITVPEKSLDMQASDWPGGIDLHVNKFSTSDFSSLVCSSHLLVESTGIDEREIWLTACKPDRQLSRYKVGEAPSQSSCLFVNTYYTRFLDRHYVCNDTLAQGSYSVQKGSIQQQLFGDCDFYSHGLQRAGWLAEDVIANCVPMQQSWARENGMLDSSAATLDCLLEQIKRKQPSVVYLQDLSLATRDVLGAIRPFTNLIVGQIASPVPPEAQVAGLDVIFSSFPHFVERFRRQGITAYYQPLAFDPRVLKSLPNLNRRYPVTFVGGLSAVHGEGTAFLERLAELIPMDFWGYGVELLGPASPIRPCHHGEAWGIDMFSRLSESFITVNRHIDVSENFANNMRLFEATGCGALLITDYKDNLHELFEIGKEVVAYRSPEECAALIKYYLAHPDEAREIAQAGHQRMLREHTYAVRMEQTAEILSRHLRYRSEERALPAPDLSTVSYGHTLIRPEDVNPKLTTAWQSDAIPLRQRALVQQELKRMYQGRVPALFQVLSDCMKPYLSNGCTVLETGCASGYYYEVLEYLSGKRIRYTGVDYSEPLISMAKSHYPSARFKVADGSRLPFQDREFAIVVSGGVLLHVPNYSEHIAESCRVAKRIVVAHRTPVCRNTPTRYLKKFGYGVEMVELVFNEKEILSIFSANGMELVKSVETASNTSQDEYGVTYVFQRR